MNLNLYISPESNILSMHIQKRFINIFKNDNDSELIRLFSDGIKPNSKFGNFSMRNCNIYSTNTPLLFIAAYYSAIECIKSLLDNGADVNIKDFHGNTVSIFAVASGSIQCAEFFSNYDVPFDNCLFVAADCGNFEMFMWIYMTQQINLNDRKNDGTCLLHHAAKSKNLQLTNFLLKEMEKILTVSDVQEVMALLSNNNYSSEDYETEDSYSESDHNQWST